MVLLKPFFPPLLYNIEITATFIFFFFFFKKKKLWETSCELFYYRQRFHNLSEAAAQQTGLCSYERYTNLCNCPKAELDANKTDFFLSLLHQKSVLVRSLGKNMLHLHGTTSKHPYSKQNNHFI